ncbi:multidrug efflux MFS transporter [Novosphingobium sp. KCTC 2891]|uniref:MDR family MFS transporter n=1 Tax=Novosphingobium sp. KCTC 2891 TaxID=2989730 RepID=UPI0022230DD1|nr:MDR family MFS transporter [Novosphingobium sp. KCTC 2891]MCW1384143.1 multidrug efflux MFS transporter [Novosphingobium sp. KCTC 2891]
MSAAALPGDAAPLPGDAEPALPASYGQPQKADLSAWLAVFAGAIGALMATLDISIVNSSLPTIQGEIGASATEGTWIATSYLVAEIVIIPLTGWLERVFGLRRFLLIAATLFTAFSVMCGLSTSLTMMIVGRIGQGFTGGAMIPTGMTIIATRLPRHQQPIGTAMFGSTLILGPVLGPLAGGWLTENLSWHYAFFINIPVCLILMVFLLVGLPSTRMRLQELFDADWLGILGMALGLGGLTVVLEEGNREQWFQSALIWQLSIVTALGFVLIGVGQLTARRPVVKLALLRNRAFASVFVLGLLIGAVLYGTSYVIPQFLAAIAGYNAFQSGQIVFLSGIPAAMMMPLFPLLITRFDMRAVVATGMLVMAMSCWLDTTLTVNSDGSDFVVSQLLRGLGQALSMLFLNQAAISSVSSDDAGDASGLFNAARNLGGSIGLALLATLQERRLDYHHWTLNSSLGANDPAVQDWVNAQAVSFGGGPEGMAAAVQSIDGMVLRQALVMAFSDEFIALMVGILAVVPLILFLRPLPKGRFQMAMH